MPLVIATSVIRGSHQGDSHGGAFLLDFEAQTARQVLDWNTLDIDWSGRGWDRGLRGVAMGEDEVLIAASDELFVFDPEFRRIASYRCPYLRHCHEISRQGDMLFLTSTGFDCLLGFDLKRRIFRWGLALTETGSRIRARVFDPTGTDGPAQGNTFHLNSIAVTDQGLFFSGLHTPGLLRYAEHSLSLHASLPQGSHNARPFRDGVLFNDTPADVVRFVSPSRQRTFDVPRYPEDRLTHGALDDSRIARQAFGRGLCPVSEGVVAAGSSPATVSLHDIDANRTTAVVTLSMDVRTAIHGLAIWTFDRP